MTQEEKELLLKDLCGRLPYEVMMQSPNGKIKFKTDGNTGALVLVESGWKPYLRPMPSMTEEEEQYVLDTWSEDSFNNGIDLMYDNYMMLGYAPDFIDWLNEHHFDYRGLIPMGLALEAPEGMYKFD